MARPSVTIIGTGALGTALVKALYKQHYDITGLYNRRFRKAESLSREVEARFVSEFPERRAELGSLVFITVQDSEITNVAYNLSKISKDFSGIDIVHCSGTQSAESLHLLKDKGADTAVFHPLQTFTHNSGPDDFKNIFFDLEGDESTLHTLKELAGSLGGDTLEIPAEAKPFLHAAAVTASNYLVALLDAAGQVAELGGLKKEEALQALLPLVYTTLRNISDTGTKRALTGPIRRGDTLTVQRHLKLLENKKNLLSLYKKLGLQTLNLAKQSGGLSGKTVMELSELFKADE